MQQCKVEFIQSFCWLYSVPNLLVIQHLETLYLGRNHVRVVCERVKKSSRVCTQEEPRDWISRLASRQRWYTCETCKGVEGSRQLQHYRTKLPIWLGSQLTTHSSCEVESLECLVCQKPDWSHSSITLLYIPLYPRNVEGIQKEF